MKFFFLIFCSPLILFISFLQVVTVEIGQPRKNNNLYSSSRLKQTKYQLFHTLCKCIFTKPASHSRNQKLFASVAYIDGFIELGATPPET